MHCLSVTDVTLRPYIRPFSDTPSGVSGFIVRSCPTFKSTCKATYRTVVRTYLLICLIKDTPVESIIHLRVPSPRSSSGLVCGVWSGSTKGAQNAKSCAPRRERYHPVKYRPLNDLIPRRVLVSSNVFASNPRTTVKWWNNGVAHSFHTRTILDSGSIGDQGWTTVETVLIRLNTSFTPSGRFPVYSNESLPDANGVESRIGYDAAVCVEKYEPWIIEAYNTSIGSPTALRIVERGDGSTSLLPSGNIRGSPIANTRYLNTTGKNPAFFVAHDNSVNQMVKDNGRDRFYVPSPTVGLVIPLHTTSFLTLVYLTGRFFH